MNNLIMSFNKIDFKVTLIFIVMDIVFGILRSIRERKTNSTIGIDGMIRKAGMIISICFLNLVDNVVNLNLIGFIPNELKDFLQLSKIGVSDLFSYLFIVFEFLSIMKNMYKCKLPIPKKLNNFLERILKEFTEEVKNENN